MPVTTTTTLSVYGFPVRFAGLGRRELLKRLGTTGISAARGAPVLSVQFVPSLRGFRLRGFNEASTQRLLGDGFALDYEHGIVYCPLSARVRVDVAERQAEHYLLSRAIVFSLALLQEANRRMAVQGAILYLHASAVAAPKGALIFCGESTFGKSTISGKLLAPYAKLEDDQTLIRLGRRQADVLVFCPRLRATHAHLPRGGSRPATLPAAGLFWLKKSRSFSIRLMDRAEAASLLFAPMVNWSQPSAVANRLAMIRALVNAVPCAELSFAKESGPLIQFLKKMGYL